MLDTANHQAHRAAPTARHFTGVRASSESAFEAAERERPNPTPPDERTRLLTEFKRAQHARYEADQRLTHALNEWKHPRYREDTLADVPRFLADLQSSTEAMADAARAILELQS